MDTFIDRPAIVPAFILALSVSALCSCDAESLPTEPLLLDEIVFQRFTDTIPDIYVVNADGTELRRLTSGQGYNYTPTWSPDGSKVAFVRYQDGRASLYKMNPDGTDQVWIANSTNGVTLPRWSPDGRRILWEDGGLAGWGVWSVNADGTNRRELVATGGQGRWSPDGSRIVFAARNEGNGRSDIFIMDADGGLPVRITSQATDDSYPTWSPDGTRVAFSSSRSGSDHIFIIGDDGSDLVQVTSDVGTSDREPLFSPDGRMILFRRKTSNQWDVMVVIADGRGLRALADSPEDEYHAAWSPDGLKIVFSGYGDSAYSRRLYAIHVNGTGLTQLTTAAGSGRYSDVFPDWH